MKLLLAGCAPFAAAAVMPEDGLGLLCPWREVTGVPCPLCGATRAFGHAVRGDGAWVDFNGAWVVLAVAVALVGLVLAVRGAAPRWVTGLPQAAQAAALVAIFGVAPWVWALSAPSV